jgi:hypothetical protein
MSMSATSRRDPQQLFPGAGRTSKRRAASKGRHAGSLTAALLAMASLATGGTAWGASPSDYNTIDPG